MLNDLIKYITIALFPICFVSCSSSSTPNNGGSNDDKTTEIELSLSGCNIGDKIYIYIFDKGDRLILTTDIIFDGLIHTIDLGRYLEGITIVSTAGVNLAAGKPTLIELIDKLSNHNDILIGLKTTTTEKLISISMVDNIDYIELSNLNFDISYPDPTMLDYTDSGTLDLRYITDIYRDGERLYRGVYSISELPTIKLRRGEYTVIVWSDYTFELNSDLHYTTTDLHSIKILSKECYWADSDYRDAFANCSDVNIIDGDNIVTIPLYRPVSKFEIITNDLKKYNIGVDSGKYPPLLDLSIEVRYDGYLPTGFNVESGKLSAVDLGYTFSSSVSNISDGYATLAKDFILTPKDAGSFINISLIVKDKNGGVINSRSGVNISYKGGCTTTIKGDFLTQSDDFTLDTDWGGELDFEF